MKKLKKFLFFGFLSVMTLFSASCSSSGDEEDLESYVKVEASAFKSRIDATTNPQILDYRSAAEYAAGHISGAINIEGTNQSAEAENGPFRSAVRNAFSTAKTIYVYGSKSTNNTLGFYLCGIISKMGWGESKTIHMINGYESWVAAGYTVEK